VASFEGLLANSRVFIPMPTAPEDTRITCNPLRLSSAICLINGAIWELFVKSRVPTLITIRFALFIILSLCVFAMFFFILNVYILNIMSETVNITSFHKKGRYFYVAADKTGEIKFHPDICLDFSIYKGAYFSFEDWKTIIYKNNYRLAWECTLRLLSIRAHCERDITNKLRQRKFTDKVITAILNECKRLKFIDDIKFAKEYIGELLAKGNGIKMIKAKLMNKGISNAVINEELINSTTPQDELEAAKRAYRKKATMLKKETDSRKKKEKLYRYLFSKGFSYDIIQTIYEDEFSPKSREY